METDPQEQQTEASISVDEFCADLSAHDRRIELIAAFHSDEKRAGRNGGTRSELKTRFDAFLKRPVG